MNADPIGRRATAKPCESRRHSHASIPLPWSWQRNGGKRMAAEALSLRVLCSLGLRRATLLALLSLAPLSQAQPKRPPGTLVGWGQMSIPYVEPGARFVALGAGGGAALTSNGSVVAWQGLLYGSVPTAAQSGITAVASGETHTVALKN